MPGKHKIRGTKVYHVARGKADRYRFHGVVKHDGKYYKQRLGLRKNLVVEVSFIPYNKPKRRAK